MCKNKALCDKIKEIIKTDIESWLYDKMCIGCELERRCHINCEHCDEFEENLYCIENNEDCEYFQDFYGFDYDDELDEEEKQRIREEFYKGEATTLGQIIYNKRKQLKLKKHDVYNNAKVHHLSYSQIENDDFARIKEETVLKVLDYLDIPFNVYFPYLKKIYKKED